MGFLKNILSGAVKDGVRKGIRDAVSAAVEKAVAPKVEEAADKVADSVAEAAQSVGNAAAAPAAGAAAAADEAETGANSGSAQRLEQAAEKLAKALEQAAAQMEEKADGMKEWNEKLAGFPLWCFGGKEFSIEETGTSDTGSTYYEFRAVGATYEDLEAYVRVLKADGFVQKYKDSDTVLYKDLGGEYLVFGTTEAFNDLDIMCVAMYRTTDENDI